MSIDHRSWCHIRFRFKDNYNKKFGISSKICPTCHKTDSICSETFWKLSEKNCYSSRIQTVRNISKTVWSGELNTGIPEVSSIFVAVLFAAENSLFFGFVLFWHYKLLLSGFNEGPTNQNWGCSWICHLVLSLILPFWAKILKLNH